MLIKKINNDMNITYDWYNRFRKPKVLSSHAYNFNEIFDNNRNNILYFSCILKKFEEYDDKI